MNPVTGLLLAWWDEGDGNRVYFALNRENMTVKIGRSRNVEARMATLRTAIPGLELLGSIPGGARAEADLHASFADERVAGEWFRLTERVAYGIGPLVRAGREAMA